MRNINLLIDGKWVTILTQDYLTPMVTKVVDKTLSTGMCNFCVKLSSDNDWHVGTSLLVGYYASFDFTSRKLSLQPLTGAKKSQVQTGSTPDLVLGTSVWKVVLLSIANFITITVLVLLCLAVYFNTNILSDEDSTENSEEPEEVP